MGLLTENVPAFAEFVAGISDAPAVVYAMVSVFLAPFIWNIIGRTEYRYHWLSKLAGSPRKGCYVLAAWIFGFSVFRDYLFVEAMRANPKSLVFAAGTAGAEWHYPVGVTLCAVGSVFVLSSYYRLKITGTYLGDYFGIFMSERVTAFPFSYLDDPMYTGATMCFLGQALEWNNAVGCFMAAWVWLVYKVATKGFEDAFTTEIYRQKELREQAAAGKQQ